MVTDLNALPELFSQSNMLVKVTFKSMNAKSMLLNYSYRNILFDSFY